MLDRIMSSYNDIVDEDISIEEESPLNQNNRQRERRHSRDCRKHNWGDMKSFDSIEEIFNDDRCLKVKKLTGGIDYSWVWCDVFVHSRWWTMHQLPCPLWFSSDSLSRERERNVVTHIVWKLNPGIPPRSVWNLSSRFCFTLKWKSILCDNIEIQRTFVIEQLSSIGWNINSIETKRYDTAQCWSI